MPIDASIPLGARIPEQKPFNVGGALADIAQIQTAQSDIAAARQKSMARMRTQQLAQQHANDPEAFIDALSAEFPMEGAIYREKYYSGMKEKALEHKAKTDADKLTLDTALQLVQGATPETWGTRRGLAVKLGGDLADQLLPQDYDLDALNKVAEIGRSATTYLDAQSKATTDFFEGKPRKAAAELFAASTTPEQWKATQEYLSQAGRQGRELVAQFGDFSPEAQANAARAALTVKEQADLTEKATDNLRQDARAQQQQAIENARLGLEKQRVGMDAARLGLERERVTLAKSEANKPKGSETVKLPAAIAEKVAGVEQSAAVLDNLEKIKKDDWIGPIAGRVSKGKITVPGLNVDPDLAEFSADTATLKNAVIKATTGAAMSEPEAQRIMEQIPDLTDKPEVWAAKAKTTRRNLALLRRRMLELSGVPQPDVPTPAAAPAPSTGKRYEIVSVK